MDLLETQLLSANLPYKDTFFSYYLFSLSRQQQFYNLLIIL